MGWDTQTGLDGGSSRHLPDLNEGLSGVAWNLDLCLPGIWPPWVPVFLTVSPPPLPTACARVASGTARASGATDGAGRQAPLTM